MTNLLRSYSSRKTGWRVKFLIKEGSKEIIEDRVMIINSQGAEYLIEPDTTDPEKILHSLEARVTKTLKDLEERDMMYMLRESLIFAVFARAIRSQSQCFVNLLVRDKKHDLQMFNNHVDKMIRSLEINYELLLGKEQADMFLDEHEDVVMDVFSKFKVAIDEGKLKEFVDHVKGFGDKPMAKEVKMELLSDDGEDRL